LNFVFEIRRLNKLDIDQRRLSNMLENNCVTFGVKVISGKWSQGYTDLYFPVYTEYLNATLNGKENKLW